MKDIFEQIDRYFEIGLGLEDIKTIKALQHSFNEKKKQLSTEAFEILEDELEEYSAKFKGLEESVQLLHQKQQEELDKKNAENENKEATKQILIEEIIKLIQDEKTIGKAFERFNQLREQWNQIATGKHTAKDKQYAKLVEDFYYHINMYKAIQDHDFKRNQQLKSDLITRLQLLSKANQSRNLIPQLKQIQKEWQAVGPVGKEQREDIWNEYIALCDKVFNLFLSLREAEQKVLEGAIKTQEGLIEETRLIVARDRKTTTDWKKDSEAILLIQNKWKETKNIPQKQQNKLYANLRVVMNAFFEAKQAFFDAQKQKNNTIKVAKSELISSVESILANPKDSEATKNIIAIQRSWKETGALPPKEEQKLWLKFRGLCNDFFNQKDAERKVELQKNKQSNDQKSELIGQAKQLNSLEALETIYINFVLSWKTSNPETAKQDVLFNDLMDEFIQKQKNPTTVQSSLNELLLNTVVKENLKPLPEVQQVIKLLSKKTQETLNQYETNLSFFSDPKSPLLKMVVNNIELAKTKLEGLKKVN